MSEAAANLDTPAMRQYRRFKQQHPDCVLFFRMGDFYEMFFDDAKLAHRVLGVTLTQRTEGIPMAGVPHHSVEGYLRRMIQAGYRVAVCDQMEDASQAKGIVRREVTRLITPGTLTDESLLEEGRDNPLAAVVIHGNATASVAWAELSTGSFSLATFRLDELADELARIGPRELLLPEGAAEDEAAGHGGEVVARVVELLGCATVRRPLWQFRQAEAMEVLCKQFGVRTLEGFGLSHEDPALGAASAVVHYLLETQVAGGTGAGETGLPHLQPPRLFSRRDYLVIDQTSLRSLEVERTLRSGSVQGSLLGVLQGCVTAMGKRLLRQWLCYPLRQRELIEARQRVVGAMVEDGGFLEGLRRSLDSVQDVQRIVGRIAVGRATPRDLVGLGRSAAAAEALTQRLAERPAVREHHRWLSEVGASLTELAGRIAAACVDAPPAHLREGGLIRDGYDAELDECRRLRRDSHGWLAEYQRRLIEQSGIASLKVGYNKVFGYYLEVTAANAGRVPPQWAGQQTLKNAQRYTTPELKQYEGKVLSAEQRAIAREQDLFVRLCEQTQQHLPALQRFAETVAELDVLACFAARAARWRYVRPTVVEEPVLDIRGGRHPVLDELLGDRFVPNDVRLGLRGRGFPPAAGNGTAGKDGEADPTAQATLALITGPNMAGKSTYIRQAALITLMAHTGSFVPAEAATVGLCDRIFTRIGASDELHTGQSTFMVEMTETANICHHATAASLVILDEIGRGTSTLDGLSLAWAIAEHLAGRGCRTLFATHYHELTALAERSAGVANLSVAVREWNDQVVFLYRILPGATDRSYGIHVAKIAGLPDGVIRRASDLLGRLVVSHAPAGRNGEAALEDANRVAPRPAAGGEQLPLFTEYLSHPVVEELRSLDINTLTPIQAFDLMRRWQERVNSIQD
jgi:DNA mismatch repair protein MutS